MVRQPYQGKGYRKLSAPQPRPDGPGRPKRRRPGPAAPIRVPPGPGPEDVPPRPEARRGSLPQAASGLDMVSTARVIRAEIGAKEASTSFSEASWSLVVSASVFSIAVRV